MSTPQPSIRSVIVVIKIELVLLDAGYYLLPAMMEQPLSPQEYEQLLKAMIFICNNMERFITQGALLPESYHDSRIQSAEDRIDKLRQQIAIEQKRIRCIRDILRRKQQLNQH